MNRYKGKNYPIMNIHERTLSVLACRVSPLRPLTIRPSGMDFSHGCSQRWSLNSTLSPPFLLFSSLNNPSLPLHPLPVSLSLSLDHFWECTNQTCYISLQPWNTQQSAISLIPYRHAVGTDPPFSSIDYKHKSSSCCEVWVGKTCTKAPITKLFYFLYHGFLCLFTVCVRGCYWSTLCSGQRPAGSL